MTADAAAPDGPRAEGPACGRDLARVALSTALGLGFSPVAPGTAGTLLGVALFAAIDLACDAAAELWVLAGVFAVVCAACVPLGTWAEAHWGRKDPRQFALDEVAGFLLTVLLFRSGNLVLTLLWAFLLSRAFDVLKPPPARRLEKLPGGWGVLLDDLAASVWAAAVLHLMAAVVPGFVGTVAG